MTPAEHTLLTRSVDDTVALGRRIGERLGIGSCVAMIGPLGAGKTQMVKGIALGAGVPASVLVNSPTFVLINEYPGRVPIYHLDAYRLHGDDEVAALGLGELVDSGCLIVEWADRITRSLPDDRITLTLTHDGPTTRRITVSPTGPNARRAIAHLTMPA